MTATLDLNLLSIARYAGRDYPEMVGLYFSEPPRRTARGRNLDRLVLYLAFEGNSPLTPEARDGALADLARLFYRTPGSVTAALRRTAEELNTLLFERNRQLGVNQQCVGLLVQIVLREDRAFLAQSGQAHVYLIASGGAQHIYDPELSGRGLGLARAAALSFSQVSLKANDVLLLAAQPSQEWSPIALASVHSQGPESLRRRLFSQTSDDLNAVALQAKQGKGKFILMRQPAQAAAPTPASPPAAAPSPAPAPHLAPPAAPTQEAEPVIPLPTAKERAAGEDRAVAPFVDEDRIFDQVIDEDQVFDQAVDEDQALEMEAVPEVVPEDAPLAETGLDAEPSLAGAAEAQPAFEPQIEAVPAAPVSAAAPPAQAARIAGAPGSAPPYARPGRERKPAPIGAALSKAGGSIKNGLNRVLGGMRTLLGRMLPDETLLNIPSGVMALVAVAVPVVIVTAATMVYFRLGRAAQYDLLSTQARQMALQAMEQTDRVARRADLGAALAQLQKAEAYTSTPEEQALIQDLYAQVRNALDELDYVRRVSYQPAIIGGLPVTSNIVGMTAFDDELYLLDGASGSVLRAVLTAQGYQLDLTFQCQPGKYGEITLGPLTEVIAWPAGYSPSAKVIASDSAGNVLYCLPDEPPTAARLTPAEAEGWGNVLETTLDQGDFYVLDLPSNGVWIYWRSNFDEKPAKFFDAETPPLQDVRDMLADRGDLYLLQMNGNMMFCPSDSLAITPTNCSIQAYIDRRPGRENLPLLPAAPFTQVITTPPPDPSLYLLEPREHAVYHFSLRSLVFQKQYLPEAPLPSRDASAFAINSGRRYLYMALGSQVFYAALP